MRDEGKGTHIDTKDKSWFFKLPKFLLYFISSQILALLQSFTFSPNLQRTLTLIFFT